MLANPTTVMRFHAGNTPERTALIYRDQRYSYRELDAQMDVVAAALHARGVGAGDAVVLMLKNCPEFLMMQGGAGRVGAAAVSASWRSTAKELAYLLDNCAARALVIDASVAAVAREVVPRFEQRLQGRVFVVGEGAAEAGFSSYEGLVRGGHAGDKPSYPARDDEARVVIYTSGTTGKPKGAVRSFGTRGGDVIMRFFAETGMRYGQTHLAVCPLYHSTAFGFVNLSFVLGSTVVLLDGFEPELVFDAIERHRVEHVALVPTMLHRLLAAGAEARQRRDLSSLRAIFTGGAPLAGPLAKRTMDAFGDILFNFYGSTETGLVTVATPQELRRAPGTIGHALAGNALRLLQPDGRQAPAGHPGELYVKNGNLVDGYHGNEEATAASMRAGYFSVGDIAVQNDEGLYFLKGRKHDMIISGGVNVYPREVEVVLLGHEAVAEAAVVGVADEEWGERVCAFVALHEDEHCDEAELLAACRATLSGPKCPREIVFVDALPRNPTGKVLRRELRARYRVASAPRPPAELAHGDAADARSAGRA
jgi:fatty-acyl-CoA synthase